VPRFLSNQADTNAPFWTMATTAIAESRNQCMGELKGLVSENIMFFLISAVAILVVPGMLIWWVVAQIANADRKEAGRQRVVGRWHFLRFGPTAPLLSLIACIGGAGPVVIFRYALSTDVFIPCVALGFLALTAFLMSMLLWMYASDPAETAKSSRPRRTGGS
jgi:hypothetical protein